MKARRIVLGSLFLVLGCELGCEGHPAPPPPEGEVRRLVLPIDQPPLPPGPGHDQYYASCVSCHSTRYVRDQPRFSRKTWLAEVDKMMKSYGAPVPPEHVPFIVDYLVSVNGAE
jgi:hypothetical protein